MRDVNGNGRGKYQWVKLSVNCFDDEKIKLIRGMPDGNMILVVWFMLLTQAGKCNARGFIILNDTIPFTHEMLARLFDFTLEEIKYALKTFERLGMVHVDEDTIVVSNFMKHHPEIEDREKWRERQRLHRGHEGGRKPAFKLIRGDRQTATPGLDAGVLVSEGDEAHKILVASPNLRGVSWERDLNIRQSRSDITDWVPVYRKIADRAEDWVNGFDNAVTWLRKQVECWGFEHALKPSLKPTAGDGQTKPWERDDREVLPPGFVRPSKRRLGDASAQEQVQATPAS